MPVKKRKKKIRNSSKPNDSSAVSRDDVRIRDDRFKHVHNDPMFQRMPKRLKRANDSDQRFSKMHTADDFKVRPRDRYGRQDDQDEDDTSDSDIDEDEDLLGLEEEELILEDKESEIPIGDATSRLAVMNMDWDHVKSVDILVLFQSFLPPGKLIKRVVIYVSQFGKERLKEEAKRGPVGLWKGSKLKEGDGGKEEELEPEIDEERQQKILDIRLRKYERERLKYYYGVVECDQVDSARHLYRECDGVEFGQTGNTIDLRYIPREMTFDKSDIRDSAKEVPDSYEAPQFFTRSLSHSKVELSWDKEDPARASAIAKAKNFNVKKGRSEKDLEVFLASDVESDGEGTDAALSVSDSEAEEGGKVTLKRRARNKFKSLLANLDSDEEGGAGGIFEMTGVEEGGEGTDIVFESTFSEAGEKLLQKVKKREEEKGMTEWERRVKKRKERTEQRKRMSRDRTGEDEASHSSEDSGNLGGSDFDYFEDSLSKTKKPKAKKKKNKFDGEAEKERKRASVELLTMGEDDDDDKEKGYSLQELEARYTQEKEASAGKKKQKKKKKKKTDKDSRETKDVGKDNFEVDMSDQRFSALFSNPEFAIDPTSPSFKKTKGTHEILKEHSRRVAGHVSSSAEEGLNAVTKEVTAKGSQKIRDPALMSVIGKIKASTARRKKKSVIRKKK